MKKHIRYFSFVLALTLIFTLFSGFTKTTASEEELSVLQENIENINLESSAESFVVEEATIEYLEADAFPAVLDKAEIQEKQYVGRVKGEERNEYTLVLKNADGSNTLRLFDYPVKYTDAAGDEKDITLKLEETAKGNYQTADNKIITTFFQKLSDGISLEYEDVAIKMVPEEQPISSVTPITPITPVMDTNDAETISATEIIGPITELTPITPVREANLSDDKETVSYPFGNKTTLEYSLTYTGFKEDIVVEEYTGQTEYTFRLYTNGLTLIQEYGSYYLADENNEIKATIGDIIIFTADERNNAFGSMTYETVTANEEYLMTIHVDAEYLKDEKTVYPIRIDPTIEINYDSNGAGAIQDVTINSLAGSSGSSTAFMIGKRETYGISRALMRFPNLSLSNIANANQITNATVEIRDLMCESTSMTVYCYPFTGNTWTESTVNWSNVSPNSYSTGASASKSISYANGVELSPRHRYGFNITAIVKGWKSGTYTQSKGIIFKASSSVENGSTYIHKTFSSYNRASNQPSLTITYTPKIELSASVVNLNMNSTQYLYATTYPAGMTVTWTSSDPSVVTVSSNGYLDGIKAGSATISASCTDSYGNSYGTYCRVYVKVPDGVYRIKNSYSHYYLNVEGGKINNYTNVSQYWYSLSLPENLYQTWKIKYLGSGYYSIRPMHNLNMGLYTNGSNVCVNDIGVTENSVSDIQPYARWMIETVSGSYLSGNFAFKCYGGLNYTLSLETDSTTNNANINVQTMENQQRQIWKLERISSPPSGALLYDTQTGSIVTTPVKYITPGETVTLSDLHLKAVAYSGQDISQAFAWFSDSNEDFVSINSVKEEFTGISHGTTIIKGDSYSDGVTTASVEFTLTVTPIANGEYYIRNKRFNTYVDIKNQSMNNEVQICQWDFLGRDSQKWIFNHIGNGEYTIKSANSSSDYYLGVLDDSENNEVNVVLRTGTIKKGMKWKFEETTDGAYKIIPKTGEINNRVLAVGWAIIGFEDDNGIGIKQRDYVNDDNYKDEWYICHTSAAVQLESQQQSLWCWVASARMASFHYMESPISQASAAVYIKTGTITSQPTMAQITQANQAGTLNEVERALEYMIGSEQCYSQYGKIYSESTLQSLLEETPVIVARNRYDANGNFLTGHDTIIVDYHWDSFYDTYIYTIFDPANGGSIISRTYQWICDGNNPNAAIEAADDRIWQGFVVYEKGNYMNTIVAPNP